MQGRENRSKVARTARKNRDRPNIPSIITKLNRVTVGSACPRQSATSATASANRGHRRAESGQCSRVGCRLVDAEKTGVAGPGIRRGVASQEARRPTRRLYELRRKVRRSSWASLAVLPRMSPAGTAASGSRRHAAAAGSSARGKVPYRRTSMTSSPLPPRAAHTVFRRWPQRAGWRELRPRPEHLIRPRPLRQLGRRGEQLPPISVRVGRAAKPKPAWKRRCAECQPRWPARR